MSCYMSHSAAGFYFCWYVSGDSMSISELQALLPQHRIAVPSRHRQWSRLCCCSPKNVCLLSKAVVMILLWALIISSIHSTGLNASSMLAIRNRKQFPNILFLAVITPYTLLAFVLLLYPLSGFLADVYCGRYKTVIFGLCVLFCAFFVLSSDSVIFLKYNYLTNLHGKSVKTAFGVVAFTGFVIYATGLAGFEANFIQLGLDQLMEAPSRYLGLFIHWVVWCTSFGASLVYVFFTVFFCDRHYATFQIITSCLPVVFCISLAILLISSCYTHRWFYTEPGHHNPYKMVLKVLNFARKHKCPIHRSALTYHEDVKPSRIDFAKDRYGGPFTSEEVEDVKTLFRILVVLLSLSPVFVLEVPTSYFMFPLFAQHTGNITSWSYISCTKKWVLLESGNLKYISSVLIFPMYVWFIYSKFRSDVPKILRRLCFGVLLYIVGTINMLIVDVIGHLLSEEDGKYKAQCMFLVNSYFPQPLHLHWWVIIPPSIILGVAPLVVHATVLEFISAQSPHPMKGLLVGVFFATRGVSRLLGALMLIPFTLSGVWSTPEMKDNPPPVNCGFGYFLLTIVTAVIGLVLFSVVSRRYKYRQREDPPYSQTVVEEVYSRYMYNVQRPLVSPRSDNEPGEMYSE